MPHSSTKERQRVLLVDDDTNFLQILSTFLQSAGYEVETAEGGMEGIRKFRRGTPEVIITDRIMPHMDGEQMTEVIKSIDPGVPVILISGRPDGLRHPALFEAVVAKPFQSAQLLSAVRIGLQKQTATAHAA